MTRTAVGCRGRTRTRAVIDSEVAELRDESDFPRRCGASVNRCHTADRAELRRRLLSCVVPCDGRSNFLNDVRTGDIGDDAPPTAAVRADRQIDRELICVRAWRSPHDFFAVQRHRARLHVHVGEAR